MTTTPCLVLLLIDRQLAAWLVKPGHAPKLQKIEGKQGWYGCADVDRLKQGIEDVRQRHGSELKADFRLEWVFDAASKALLEAALPKLAPLLAASRWQLQRWEVLAERSAAASERPPLDWVESQLVPLLLAGSDAEERLRLKEAAEREQNEALRQVDGERLLTYLPALFPRVFTELSGADLALLTGRVEPYPIPNPYPEPSPETLHTLQRGFRALPREHQREIVGFIAHLPQRQQLRPRPEMQDLVRELESEISDGQKGR
jgi:hypothetical protein